MYTFHSFLNFDSVLLQASVILAGTVEGAKSVGDQILS